jgi:hypothetical protein
VVNTHIPNNQLNVSILKMLKISVITVIIIPHVIAADNKELRQELLLLQKIINRITSENRGIKASITVT